VEGNCFWCRRREWRWVYSNSVCSLSFFLFSCGLCFCVCALVRCTPQFGSAYSFNPFLFILISAIDIAPLICHSPSHAQPSHAHCHIHASPTLFLSFFLARICFSSCMAQAKPRAPYAIYALAFNVSHPKSDRMRPDMHIRVGKTDDPDTLMVLAIRAETGGSWVWKGGI